MGIGIEDWQGMLLGLGCSLLVPSLMYLFFYIIPVFLDKRKVKKGELSKEQRILLGQAELAKYNDYKILINEYNSLVNQSYLNVYNYAKSDKLSDYDYLKEVRKCEYALYDKISKKKAELDTIMERGSSLHSEWFHLYSLYFGLEDVISDGLLRRRTPYRVSTEHCLVLLENANAAFERQKSNLSVRLTNEVLKTENELLSII